MSQLPEPEVVNRFPDCVAMKLHFYAVEPQQPEFSLSRPSIVSQRPTAEAQAGAEVDLHLTINFSGEQEMEVPGGRLLGLPGGRITFGIRRGRLRFSLQNCKMPLEKVALNEPFQVSIEIETQQEQSREASASLTSPLSEIAGATGVGSLKQGQKSTSQLKDIVFQVKKSGDEYHPSWIFEAQGNRAFLEGLLVDKQLGTLGTLNDSCEVTAEFEVRGEDTHLTWGRLGLTKDLARNKTALIERAIALRYVKPQIEANALSQVRWQHG